MAKLLIKAALVCSIGCVRKNNEDNFFFQGDFMRLDEMDAGAHIADEFRDGVQVYAVFDGVGGEYAGERASFLATSVLETHMERIVRKNTAREIRRYALAASRAVYQDGVAAGVKDGREGSTMALLCLKNKTAYVANVGDSRVYLLRSGRLQQLSCDHTDVFAMYRAGELTAEEMRKHARGNVINHYIGMEPAKMPEDYVFQHAVPLRRNDRLLICSDGVSDLMPEHQLQSILSAAQDVDHAAADLVSMALALGGKDNTTAIVVEAVDSRLKKPKQVNTTVIGDDMPTELITDPVEG